MTDILHKYAWSQLSLIFSARPKVVVMAVCFKMRKMTFVYPSMGHQIDYYPTNVNNKATDVGLRIIMLDRQKQSFFFFFKYNERPSVDLFENLK